MADEQHAPVLVEEQGGGTDDESSEPEDPDLASGEDSEPEDACLVDGDDSEPEDPDLTSGGDSEPEDPSLADGGDSEPEDPDSANEQGGGEAGEEGDTVAELSHRQHDKALRAKLEAELESAIDGERWAEVTDIEAKLTQFLTPRAGGSDALTVPPATPASSAVPRTMADIVLAASGKSAGGNSKRRGSITAHQVAKMAAHRGAAGDDGKRRSHTVTVASFAVFRRPLCTANTCAFMRW